MRKLFLLSIVMVFCAFVSGCGLIDGLTNVFSSADEDYSDDSNRTQRNLELQKELAGKVEVENVDVSEDTYGNTVLKATVTMPDYSSIFVMGKEEIETENYETYEELLLEYAGKYVEKVYNAGEQSDEMKVVTREIIIDAADIGMGQDESDWEDMVFEEGELQDLVANMAVEEELNKFAMDIMMEYALDENIFDILETDGQEDK